MFPFRGVPRPSAVLTWALMGLRLAAALVALALILVPGELWAQRTNDMSVAGFDRQTAYLDASPGRYGIDPFQVLSNGDWHSCPCAPGAMLVLVGKHVSPVDDQNPEGAESLAGVTVSTDERSARVYLVRDDRVNFLLPADVQAPGGYVVVRRDGTEIGRQFIEVTGGSSANVESRPTTISRAQLELFATPGNQPSIHLLTTPRSFRASFDAAVMSDGGGRPLEVMLWNPRTFGAVSLVFDSAPDHRLQAVVSESKGEVTARRDLGTWEPGRRYHIEVGRQSGEEVVLSVGVADAPGEAVRAVFHAEDAPTLFSGYRPTLTVTSQAQALTTYVALSRYRLELPHERFLSVRIDDAKVLPIAAALLVLSLLLHLPLLRLRRLSLGGMSEAARSLRDRWWLAIPATAAFAGIGWTMTLGSHPFDMASQTTWTYLLVNGGLGDLYYRAQTVPLAAIWGGVPYHEAVYPYGVSMSYYFLAIGRAYQLFGGDVTPGSSGLAIAIKVANLGVALIDAGILFALARSFGRRRFAWVAPVLFLLNPAMLFDIAIWGETESVALFFLLASILASRRGSARSAWALLALAFLGKQTVVVPAMLTAVYYLRLFPLRRTLEGISVAAPLVLATVLPFIAAGYSPSIAIDPILGAFSVFGGSDSEPVFNVVSYDAYSVWPLVTLLRHGQHGPARLQFPDSTSAFGMASYQQMGVLAFLLTVALLAIWLLRSRRAKSDPGAIFLVLALAMMAELILPTRSIARYLVFPIVFALTASANEPSSKALWFVAITLTCTSLIGMLGSVASGIDSNPAVAPRLANGVSDAALQLFRSDWTITIGSSADVAALLLLAAHVFVPPGMHLRMPAWRTRDWRMPSPMHEGTKTESGGVA